jgi:PAS domain S-box-containing protein
MKTLSPDKSSPCFWELHRLDVIIGCLLTVLGVVTYKVYQSATKPEDVLTLLDERTNQMQADQDSKFNMLMANHTEAMVGQRKAHTVQIEKLNESFKRYLREKDHLAVFLEEAGFGIVHADKDHKIVGWSETMTDKFGYTAQEATELVLEQLMAGSERVRHICKYDTSIGSPSGHVHLLDCDKALHKDGHTFETSILVMAVSKDHAIAMFPPSGARVVKSLTGSLTDFDVGTKPITTTGTPDR